MDMLGLILALSMIMWYLIDRFKPIWEGFTYGKYITMGISAIAGFALVFSLGLDILVGLGLLTSMTIAGQVMTGFVLMAGSSAISEIITLIKK
jgi:hypothetical protein